MNTKKGKKKNANRGQNRHMLNAITRNTYQHLPPAPYSPNIIVSTKFRFRANVSAGSASYVITPAKLCSLQVICTTVNSLATQFYEAVRLRRVTVYGMSSSTGVMEVFVTCPGTALGIQGRDMVKSDISLGQTFIAKTELKLSPATQAGQWQSGSTATGTNTMFTVGYTLDGTTTAQFIVEVDVALRVTQDIRTSNNTVSIASGSLTGVYYLALDNAAGGTGAIGNNLKPDGDLVTTS